MRIMVSTVFTIKKNTGSKLNIKEQKTSKINYI